MEGAQWHLNYKLLGRKVVGYATSCGIICKIEEYHLIPLREPVNVQQSTRFLGDIFLVIFIERCALRG